MNANDAVDHLTQAQIDRLVAGELPEGERRNLLVWFDEDVRRWRSCAIAFLEAQSWEAAAASLATGAAAKGNQSSSQSKVTFVVAANHRQRRAGLQALVLVASIAIAFMIGQRSAPFWRRSQPALLPGIVEPAKATGGASTVKQPLMATVAVRTNLDPGVLAQLQLPVSPLDSGEAPESSISEYDRKQWERQGFELTEERRYLPARLPDGRQVVVPVNKVRVKVKRTPVS
jgi:hypothetical protein